LSAQPPGAINGRKLRSTRKWSWKLEDEFTKELMHALAILDGEVGTNRDLPSICLMGQDNVVSLRDSRAFCFEIKADSFEKNFLVAED
jgi:hypothetical protein